MKKKLYQKPNIKVHEVPKDALLAASPDRGTTNFPLSGNDGNPTGDGPIIDAKRGNLGGDDEA